VTRYNIVVDDVWDKETWETINCALPDGNCGSKVIMTTRNSHVNTSGSDVYMIKPLSLDKSRELFYKRISKKNGDNQLIDKILDKCDGVPLAIIAIASLLADRQLEDWQVVYDSIVFGCQDDKTRTILLYSYYDLPPYLKPCLLYLSMYPEDHLIEKSTLVRTWIAEGFVQPEKDWRSSLFEVGERYFDELLNRSMIQPAEIKRFGVIDGCHVHDIVLDLIHDLSTEENFVTVIDEKQNVSSKSVKRTKQVGLYGFGRKMRRLSIQWSNGKSISHDTIGVPEVVRSLHAFDCVPLLSSFQAIRVLSKKGLTEIGDLKHLCKLRHLRYLEISCYECPKEIGNLKSLQTLIIYIGTAQLPPTIFELTQLMCLCTSNVFWNVPADKMVNLKCLEELELQIIGTNEDSLVELGRMTRLRVLKIFVGYVKKTWYKALMHSLSNLQEIRELKLWSYHDGIVRAWESWEPPRQLWSLETNFGLSPQLMDPSHFQHIRYLCLSIDFKEVDMGILALLRELSLKLWSYHKHCQEFIIRAEGFENLRVCKAEAKFKFLKGAMLRLESLLFKVRPGSDLDFNLATLLSLKEVFITVDCSGYFRTDVMETEAVVRLAVEDHPNSPTLQISRIDENDMLHDDEMKVQYINNSCGFFPYVLLVLWYVCIYWTHQLLSPIHEFCSLTKWYAPFSMCGRVGGMDTTKFAKKSTCSSIVRLRKSIATSIVRVPGFLR
jgi:hypothetical protein